MHILSGIYKSLKISSGETITETGDNLRYYYTVIKGITSAYNNYTINATTKLVLNDNTVVECSGFTYTINL